MYDTEGSIVRSLDSKAFKYHSRHVSNTTEMADVPDSIRSLMGVWVQVPPSVLKQLSHPSAQNLVPCEQRRREAYHGRDPLECLILRSNPDDDARLNSAPRGLVNSLSAGSPAVEGPRGRAG